MLFDVVYDRMISVFVGVWTLELSLVSLGWLSRVQNELLVLL